MISNKSATTIGIIGGKGLMGRLFHQLFSQAGYAVICSDTDTKLTNRSLARRAEVIIISVPIDRTLSVINEISASLRKNQLLIDLTSIKLPVIDVMKKSRSEIISIHPMFGPTSFGPGQRVIFCPVRATKKSEKWLMDLLRGWDLMIFRMTPEKHDEIMTIVQSLVHFAEITFIGALKKLGGKVAEYLPYSSPSSELKILMAARILAQDPNLYGNIQIQNPGSLPVFKKYIEAIEELSAIVAAKDLKAFEKYYREAAAFLGHYKDEAMRESDWLIAQIMEKNRRKQKAAGLSFPSHEVAKMREKKHKATMAVLGPEHTFSDLAADKWLKASCFSHCTKKFCESITAVFEEVADGNCRFGLIPIENTLDGSIQESHDQLFEKNVQVIAEIVLPIHHALIVHKDSKKADITALASHPKALAQCAGYLRKHFSGIEKIHFSSTAAAVKNIADCKSLDIAAIGNKETAAYAGLKILAEKIEDNKKNQTVFLVISEKEKKYPLAGARYKTSIAFYFGQNKPGILHGVFEEFSRLNIDISKIESRPSRKSRGDYIFYLDFLAHKDSTAGKTVLKNVKKKVAKLKIFGTYPVAR